MAQQNIDFGTFPNDPNADAIRSAFQKVQENFTELFSGTSSPSSGNSSQVVTSINRTPGAGITVNSPYGNVVVNANISNVQVYTNTLSIGLNSNGGQYATLTSSAQTLFIDLPANISNVNNIALANGVVANYITANVSLTAGNANLGNLAIANFFQGDGSLLTNVGTTTYTAGTGLTLIGNEFSVNASQPNITSVGTLTGLGVNGNITAVNITANTGVFTGNGSGLSAIALANVVGAGNIASINLDGNVSNILTGAGTFVAIPTVSANANYANFAGNAFSVDGANVSGTVANATYAANAGNANIANTAYSVDVSNVANIGNIATVNLDGNVSNLLTGNGTFVAIPTGGASQILDLPAATALTGNERFEVAQVSTTVVLTATTISALASDNSFNDSGNGFLTAGFAVGDRITASGFASAVNNLDAGVITSVTAGKMIIGGVDGDVIVDGAAGPTVTIAKWVSRQVSLREIQNTLPQRIGMFATTTPTASEPLVLYCVPNALKFPANFAGSTGAIATGGANPAASFVMSVFKNATQVGTITVSTGGVFSFATTGGLDQLVAAGDVIRILGPETPDTTITNLAATLILEE